MPFACALAVHADWRVAFDQVRTQLRAQAGPRPATLGFVYCTDHLAPQADDLLHALRREWPGVAFVGGAAVGILANGQEALDEPALAVMLADLPADTFRVFSGAKPLPAGAAHSALVHADPAAPDVADLIDELSQRTAAGYLFGGLVSSRARAVQWAQGVVTGGLSGVGFDAEVALISRVTQGCQPVGPVRQVTDAERNLVLALDGEPALPALLADLSLDLADPRQALPVLRATLVGLTDAGDDMLSRAGQFGADVRVRHLIGLDPSRDAVAVAEMLEPGTQMAFCRRDMPAARRDLDRKSVV